MIFYGGIQIFLIPAVNLHVKKTSHFSKCNVPPMNYYLKLRLLSYHADPLLNLITVLDLVYHGNCEDVLVA